MVIGDLFGRIMLQNNALMYFWRRCISQSLDSAVQTVLVKLYTLYGLWCLDKHLTLLYQGKGFTFHIEWSELIILNGNYSGFTVVWFGLFVCYFVLEGTLQCKHFDEK